MTSYEHRNLVPLPTPHASVWQIVSTCVRRAALLIELTQVDARLEELEIRAWQTGHRRKIAEQNGRVCEADWLAEEGVALAASIRTLKIRQMTLEAEGRG